MTPTDEQRRQWLLAATRARAVLKPGDRITFTSCPGTKRWGVFDRWDGNWACTRTRNDVSAQSISKVNGVAVSFVEG